MNLEDNYSMTRNNPHESTDYTKEDAAFDSAIERNNDSRGDTETIRKKRNNVVYSHAFFVDVCDLQIGGQGYQSERANLAVNSVYKLYNSIVVAGGDGMNNGSVVSATSVFGERLTPTEQIDVLAYFYLSKDGKVSCVIGGNHDAAWGNRNRATNTDWSKMLANRLGADYVPFAVVYQQPLLTPDTLEAKTANIFVCHSSMSGNKVDVNDKAMRYVMGKLASENILVDVVITEHLHTGSQAMLNINLPNYDKNGTRLGDLNHTVFFLNGKTFQSPDSDFGSSHMFVNTTNLVGLDLSWKLNPYYTKSNSNVTEKYIIEANPIHVLARDKNELSMAFKKYLASYEIPNLEEYKEYWGKQSITKIAAEVENFSDTYKENLSKDLKQMSNGKEK